MPASGQLAGAGEEEDKGQLAHCFSIGDRKTHHSMLGLENAVTSVFFPQRKTAPKGPN